ncbi:MAG: RNA polymerase sigma factor [Acetatifactor sp.]|nr:RNA polymerase sigma factor [Acetatifactor sp.]
MKDDLLIKRIRAGDEDAAEKIVRRYYAQVMRFCKWQCNNTDMSEDLTQETFLKVFRCLGQYKKRGHFKAWLFCVARSVCMDELRKRRIEYEPDTDICEIEDEYDGIRHAEDASEIRELLSHLPDEQKEALILRYMSGFSYREMGDILNIPYRTAQSRVNLAIKTLRQKGVNK